MVPHGAPSQAAQLVNYGWHPKPLRIITWLDRKMHVLNINPDSRYQTIFVLDLRCTPPQSLDSCGCVSHHPRIQALGDFHFTDLDSFATVIGNPSTKGPDAARDALTATAIHELAEAATDTGSHGWHLPIGDPNHPWLSTSAFAADELPFDEEAGDMLQGSRWFERYRPRGFAHSIRYEYVRVFSDYGNAHRDDPGVPVSPHPHFKVTTGKDWYHVRLGGSRRVTVTGWSTKSIPRWSVRAEVWSFAGNRSSGFTGSGASSPCSLTTRRWKVTNGGTFKLTVRTTAAAKHQVWCLILLSSALAPVPAKGDQFHPWFVEFEID